MSYNISKWTTKELKDFRVPMSAWYASTENQKSNGWFAEDAYTISDGPDGLLLHVVLPGGYVEGVLGPDAWMTVTCMNLSGEGSGGTYYWEVFEPALRLSTGKLEAVRIWANGDSIDRLRVNDGVVLREQVEL